MRTELGLWMSKGGPAAATTLKKPNVGEGSLKRGTTKGRRTRSSIGAGEKTLEAKSAASRDEFVVPTGDGLYPASIPQGGSGRGINAILENFHFMGKFMAKALVDDRHLDLRLSTQFYEDVLRFARRVAEGEKLEELEMDPPELVGSGIGLLLEIDPVLYTSLRAISDIRDDEESIANLCLNFTLPGNERIELVSGGKSKPLTAENVEDYLRAVVMYMRYTGVRRQMKEFVTGFNSILNIGDLRMFNATELDLLFCGPSFEQWTKDYLVRATKCDHGYTHESDAVKFLVNILCELGPDDQRLFLLFVTGTPRLPVGGLLGLRPRLTIVRRNPEPGREPDQSLPTVMTCTNYLKLPNYSSERIARQRLLFALQEGQGSFHLS
eukprot:Plantae.Rhodophyta-Rhodochaete_pulchella.ctg3036.p2 GENE.Plantae.Rhodophyta-Rhodochaete_pulchella.ctg3036~~Plantae.Rhodophyta-Rhodochaete_pulchella.ctg3036.p2  ORF type:complete len:381 (+),score=70.25 Plantae.Rhodophyta-Rhodochaete_pulchella.ctg3036:924-2066(+)